MGNFIWWWRHITWVTWRRSCFLRHSFIQGLHCMTMWEKFKQTKQETRKQLTTSLVDPWVHLNPIHPWPKEAFEGWWTRKKQHGKTQPSCTGRKWLLCPMDECALVWNVQMNPRTTIKDTVKLLADIEKIHRKMRSIPIWTKEPYREGKQLLQNHH